MTSAWFQRLPGSRPAELRLYAFPFAGAGHTVFRHWRERLPPDVELALVKLPGRGARYAEPAAASIDALADALAQAIAGQGEHRFAFLGHSMGALLAFETARRLAGRGPEPVLLAVSASGAPSARAGRPPVATLPDPAFMDHLRSMQGLPKALLDEPEHLGFFLPIIRADFALCEAYRWQPAAPLRCPLLVLAGADDPAVPLPSLAGWARETQAPCERIVWPGGHFFLFEHEEALLRLVVQRAREAHTLHD